MAAWDTGKIEFLCSHCEAENVVKYKDCPQLDKDVVNCAKCGSDLYRWKNTRDYDIAVLKETLNDP